MVESGIMRSRYMIPILVLLTQMVIAMPLAAETPPPFYPDKSNLLVYIEAGEARPVTNPDDWQKRRAHILANMELVMGPFPDDARRVPLDIQVLDEQDFPAFTRRKITYSAEPGDRVPAYLLVPKGIDERVPGVLCLHPTYEHGKDMVVGLGDKPNRNYAEELAGRGYVALAPDYMTFGEYRAVDPYALGYQSGTMKCIWNHVRAVDVLQSLPEVDPARIGCIGHSLGGHNTLFAGVFDPRIKVMVTSCGFNAFPKYYEGNLTGWTSNRYMPRIDTVYGKDPARMPFDFTEVLAALAPRPVFVNAPLRDANFEVSGVYDCLAAARPVYALFGAEDRLVAQHPDCEHDFPPEVREAAYAFMASALEAEEP
ncbi:MAG: acetylxylan esterase [Candidatus Hydrogenedentes bacterium]|nr:acetylxylan esterase [Candidatus Hydrogenedentota bacterium]